MTPRGLTRLRIADLVVELPADLELPDEAVLEANLRPFTEESAGPADIVVGRVALPVDEVSLPEGSFRVDVNRAGGRADDDPVVKPYWLWDASFSIHVRGALASALEVVAGIHLGLAHLLPKRDGLLLHASAVRAAGSAFVFAGPAESGKSTAANGFTGGTLLADERVAVRCAAPGSQFTAHSSQRRSSTPTPTPTGESRTGTRWKGYPVPMWGGKYAPVASDVVPLAMVVAVRKNAPLAASVMTATAAMGVLARAVVHNHYDGMRAEWVLGVLARLATEVPVVELSYGLGESFADVLLGRAGTVRREEASC